MADLPVIGIYRENENRCAASWGASTIFVHLAGCAAKCRECRRACQTTSAGVLLAAEDAADRVRKLSDGSASRLHLYGGEPFIHDPAALTTLLDAAAAMGFRETWIETPLIRPHPWLRRYQQERPAPLIRLIGWSLLPSSGMECAQESPEELRRGDVVSYHCRTDDDWEQASFRLPRIQTFGPLVQIVADASRRRWACQQWESLDHPSLARLDVRLVLI